MSSTVARRAFRSPATSPRPCLPNRAIGVTGSTGCHDARKRCRPENRSSSRHSPARRNTPDRENRLFQHPAMGTCGLIHRVRGCPEVACSQFLASPSRAARGGVDQCRPMRPRFAQCQQVHGSTKMRWLQWWWGCPHLDRGSRRTQPPSPDCHQSTDYARNVVRSVANMPRTASVSGRTVNVREMAAAHQVSAQT